MTAQPEQPQDDLLCMQEHLKDMQSMLILQNIRKDHDEDPTVLAAIDRAIALLKQRIERQRADR